MGRKGQAIVGIAVTPIIAALQVVYADEVKDEVETENVLGV